MTTPPEKSPHSQAPQLFTWLEGIWDFKRVITGSENAHMKSMASFTPKNDIEKNGSLVLLYEESGALHLDNGITISDARQSYLFSYDPDTESLLVDFAMGPEKGLRFLLLPLAKFPHLVGTHPCRDDLYEAMFDFDLAQNQWRLSYHVIGPHKNYHHVTEYQKRSR